MMSDSKRYAKTVEKTRLLQDVLKIQNTKRDEEMKLSVML